MEEAQRYHDQIISALQAQYPEQKTFTRDQIDEHCVMQWGTTASDMGVQRAGAIEAVRATTPDPVARGEAESRVNDYFDQKRDSFDQQYNAAVRQVYAENGIPLDGPVRDGRSPQSVQQVPVRTIEDRATEDEWQRFGAGNPNPVIFEQRSSALGDSVPSRVTLDGLAESRLNDQARQVADISPRRSATMTQHDFGAVLQGDTQKEGEKTRADQLNPELIPPKHMRQQFGFDPKAQSDSAYFTQPTVTLAEYRQQREQDSTEPQRAPDRSRGPELGM